MIEDAWQPYSRREISSESVTVEVLGVHQGARRHQFGAGRMAGSYGEARQPRLGARTRGWGIGFEDMNSPEHAPRTPTTCLRAIAAPRTRRDRSPVPREFSLPCRVFCRVILCAGDLSRRELRLFDGFAPPFTLPGAGQRPPPWFSCSGMARQAQQWHHALGPESVGHRPVV